MHEALLWIASLLSALTFAVHTFIGGPRVAAPLLADQQLPRASKWLNYYCWHITTVLLAAMTLAFALVATGKASLDLAIFLGLLAPCLSALSAVVAIMGGIQPWRFPSTTLFLLIGAAALGALIA